MNLVLAKTDTGRPLGDIFALAQDRLPGAGAVRDARRAAFADYERRGLPHRRIEEWKYTDLLKMLREIAPLAGAPDQAALKCAAAALGAHAIDGVIRLVLVDGVFAPELSDRAPAGVRVTTLREVLDSETNAARADLLMSKVADAMLSLNAAMATDGVVVTIDDGAALNRPLHLVHVATASSASAFTRSHLQLGKGAKATLVESFIAAEGATAYQAHDAVVVWLGDTAQLDHVRLMSDALDAANITTGIFTIGAHAKLNLFNMTSGGRVSRYQGFITLAGEGGDLNANGVNLLKGTQHGDMTLVVDHAVPHGTSREVFRAVLDDRAHSVFQGRIIVQPHAQKTDGKMMSRALLLSDEAEADNKPELEIFADDVACGHGTTVGALDESLKFYLRARGLPEKEAEALLVQAFVGEAIEAIADETLREHAVETAARWLAARG